MSGLTYGFDTFYATVELCIISRRQRKVFDLHLHFMRQTRMQHSEGVRGGWLGR